MAWCMEACSSLALLAFNGVDLVCGLILASYGLFLGFNHYAPEWLFAPLVVIGVILVVAVVMSSCGLLLRRFSACMTAASEIFQILALAELGLAVAIFTQGASIDRFLRDHQYELEMSDTDLRQFEHNKYMPGYILIGLFAMEALRYQYSGDLHRARLRREYRYQIIA